MRYEVTTCNIYIQKLLQNIYLRVANIQIKKMFGFNFFSFVVAAAFAAMVMAGTLVKPESGNSTIASSTCGGNCPGGCASCPCGSSSSYQSISSWCAKYSWNQANCQCIMNAESGGNANAVNQNSGGSYDVGLWQINDFNWNACSGGAAPCNPNTNLQCGKNRFQHLHTASLLSLHHLFTHTVYLIHFCLLSRYCDVSHRCVQVGR